MVTWELDSGAFWPWKSMCKMWSGLHLEAANIRGHGYMTGRARMVNTVFWLSYFVLLCNEVQAQPCLSLNNQSQLLQALGWEDKHRKFCPPSSHVSSPPFIGNIFL